MKKIPLSNRKGKIKYAIIDDEDYEKVNNYPHPWLYRFDDKKNLEYALTNIGDGTGRMLRMHRFILNLSKGDPIVDHKNHNGLDNRKQNLRICNGTLNNCNSIKTKRRCYSRYKGVSWDIYRNKWSSYIHKYGIKIDIGKWEEEWKAAVAYNFWAIHLFEDFAYLNDTSNENISEIDLDSFIKYLIANYNKRIGRYDFKNEKKY